MPYLGKQPAASALVVESGSIQSAEIEDGTIEDSDISSNFKGLLSGSAVVNASSVTAASISGSITSTGSFGSLIIADKVQGNLDLGGNITAVGISGSITSTGSFGKVEVGGGKIITTGNMVLDADGAQIRLEDGGTEFGRLSRVSSDLVIKSITNDKDMLFKGVDNSSTITALSLDMSEGGNAEFSGNVSGSLVSTASFGSVNATHLNGVFEGTLGSVANALISGSTVVNAPNISGSITSTGSFGSLVVADKVQGNLDLGGNITAAGDISTSGSIFAREFHTEFTSASVIFASGSNKFGDDSGDTHRFTGSMLVSGSITMADGDLTVTDNLDIEGDVDINGTTNLDNTDIDGNLDVSGNVTGSITSTGSFGSIVTGGTLTLSDSLDMQDNNKILLGTGDDLEIFFDGTNSIFDHTPGGGQMFIRSDQIAIDDSQSTPKNYATFYQGTGVVLNEDSEDHDFRVESNANTHLLFADGGNSKVGIQESSFSYTDYSVFHIKGRGSDDSNVTGMTFHASSSNANSRNFSITTNNSAHGALDFRVSEAINNTPNTNLIMQLSKGTVGIGTTSPDGTLHVHTGTAGSVTAASDADDLVVETGGSGGISILTPAANQGEIAFGNPNDNNIGRFAYNHPGGYFALVAVANEVMRISGSGAIGLGASVPGVVNGTDRRGGGDTGILHLQGTVPRMIFDDNGDTPQYAITAQDFFQITNVPDSSASEAQLLRINSDGKMLVGSGSQTTPSDELHVDNGTSNTGCFIRVQNDGTTGYVGAGLILNAKNAQSRGAGVFMHNQHADKGFYAGVIYNVAFERYSICYEARALQDESTAESAHEIVQIQTDGDYLSTTGTAIQTISDRRLKENIQDFTGGLDVLKNLQPRTFEWKEGRGNNRFGRTGTQYGFIAQEIESGSGVVDNMNLYKKVDIADGELDSDILDGTKYQSQLNAKDALYISAIKELSEKIELQQKQIEELKEGQNG